MIIILVDGTVGWRPQIYTHSLKLYTHEFRVDGLCYIPMMLFFFLAIQKQSKKKNHKFSHTPKSRCLFYFFLFLLISIEFFTEKHTQHLRKSRTYHLCSRIHYGHTTEKSRFSCINGINWTVRQRTLFDFHFIAQLYYESSHL